MGEDPNMGNRSIMNLLSPLLPHPVAYAKPFSFISLFSKTLFTHLLLSLRLIIAMICHDPPPNPERETDVRFDDARSHPLSIRVPECLIVPSYYDSIAHFLG